MLALGRFTQELEYLLDVLVDVVPRDSVKPQVRRTIEWDLASVRAAMGSRGPKAAARRLGRRQSRCLRNGTAESAG